MLSHLIVAVAGSMNHLSVIRFHMVPEPDSIPCGYAT